MASAGYFCSFSWDPCTMGRACVFAGCPDRMGPDQSRARRSTSRCPWTGTYPELGLLIDMFLFSKSLNVGRYCRALSNTPLGQFNGISYITIGNPLPFIASCFNYRKHINTRSSKPFRLVFDFGYQDRILLALLQCIFYF